MEEKCPCENCICIPICQSKQYINLVGDCSLITKYLISPCDMVVRPSNRLKKIKEIINPTLWDYNTSTKTYGEKYTWVECDQAKIKHMKGE